MQQEALRPLRLGREGKVYLSLLPVRAPLLLQLLLFAVNLVAPGEGAKWDKRMLGVWKTIPNKPLRIGTCGLPVPLRVGNT